MAHHAARVQKARSNIFRLEPWISLENGFRRIPGGEHPEYVLDRQAVAADDRLAPENLRVRGDAPQKLGFAVHFVDSLRVMVNESPGRRSSVRGAEC